MKEATMIAQIIKEVVVKKLVISAIVLLLGAALAFGGGSAETPAASPDSGTLAKPASLSIAAWGISGDTYAQYVSVGEALKTKYGISFRVVPTGTDISRMMLLRTKATDFAGIGTANIYALEGLGEFAAMDVGPTPMRAVYLCLTSAGSSAAVRATSGIHTFADLKGKRVPCIAGAPGINSIYEGWLAWGGLTWNDVIKVDVPSTAASYESVLDGIADVTYGPVAGSWAYKLEASPHGIRWLQMPPDAEKWAAFNKYNPMYWPKEFSTGAGLSKTNTVWGLGTILPSVLALPDTPDAVAYWATKTMWESYDAYKGAIAGMAETWDLKNFMETGLGIFPWHEGSIKYLKEFGLWTDRHEAGQKLLLERQAEVMKLWKATVEKAIDLRMAHTDFPAFWLKARQEKFGDQWFVTYK
jgi:hypothetical protein